MDSLLGLKHKDAQRLCQRRAKTWDSIFSKWENHQIENPTDDDEGEFGFHDDDWDIKDDPILGAANRNDTDSESNDEEEEDSDMQSAIASVYQMAKANLKPAKRRNKENQDPNGSIIGQFEQMSCSTPKQKNGGRRAVKTEKDPDLVCTHCEKQTGLPREALEGTGQVAETFLCNHCVIEQSGHRDCTVEDCEACETIGAEMTRRSYFEFGETGEDDEEDFISVTLDVMKVESEANISRDFEAETPKRQWQLVPSKAIKLDRASILRNDHFGMNMTI